MSGPTPMRASDQDRHEAVLALSDHFADGRLDREEFELRMTSASEATYLHELDPLFADLPLRATRRPVVKQASTQPRKRAGFRGAPMLLPPLLAVFIAIAVLSHGHAWWLIFPMWWFFASASRGRAWHHRSAEAHHRHPWS